jgi:hypothetical protein
MVPMSQFCECVPGVTRVWRVRHTWGNCPSPLSDLIEMVCLVLLAFTTELIRMQSGKKKFKASVDQDSILHVLISRQLSSKLNEYTTKFNQTTKQKLHVNTTHILPKFQRRIWMTDLGPNTTALVGCPLLSKFIGNGLATRRCPLTTAPFSFLRTLGPSICQSDRNLADGTPSSSISRLFSSR